jgi:hypothetical protein
MFAHRGGAALLTVAAIPVVVAVAVAVAVVVVAAAFVVASVSVMVVVVFGRLGLVVVEGLLVGRSRRQEDVWLSLRGIRFVVAVTVVL